MPPPTSSRRQRIVSSTLRIAAVDPRRGTRSPGRVAERRRPRIQIVPVILAGVAAGIDKHPNDRFVTSDRIQYASMGTSVGVEPAEIDRQASGTRTAVVATEVSTTDSSVTLPVTFAEIHGT